MLIDEIAESHGILRRDTHNLFWGVFPFGIQLTLPPKWSEQRAAKVQRFWTTIKNVGPKQLRKELYRLDKIHRDHRKKITDLVDGLLSGMDLDNSDYTYRTNDGVGAKHSSLTFYSKHENHAVEFLKSNPDSSFSSVSRPRDETALRLMNDVAGKNVIVRSAGWFHNDPSSPKGGYTYKVELQPDWSRGVTQRDLVRKVHNISFVDLYFSEGTNLYLYLNSEDDLFLAKIGLGGFIKKVTQCIINDK